MRDTVRAAQTVELSVGNQLRVPMDVQGVAFAPAEPWLPSPLDGFTFPAQMVEAGGGAAARRKLLALLLALLALVLPLSASGGAALPYIRPQHASWRL